MNRATRFLAIAPLVGGLGLVSAYAIKAGATDAIVYSASKEMGTWSASGVQPGNPTWQWVHDDLEHALSRAPSDPAIHELLGILSNRRPDRGEYQADAIVHFVKAIESRPTSPYSWVNLAEAKYRLGETDKQFELALVRAAQLGPSEPEVQRGVAFYGLAVYDEVGANARGAIENMVTAGLRRNPLEMLQISDRRGRLGLACRRAAGLPRIDLNIDSKSSQLCQSSEATS